jgi:hypothetical protein
MTARKLLFAATVALAVVASVATQSEAADPAPFGPIASSSFTFVKGTSLEAPKGQCVNGDVLLIRGPGLGNAKSADVSPRTFAYPNNQNRDKYGCEAPDCYQLFFQLSSKDAVGPRTVTLKSADGRSVTTKFDIVANAGRCDYQKGTGMR